MSALLDLPKSFIYFRNDKSRDPTTNAGVFLNFRDFAWSGHFLLLTAAFKVCRRMPAQDRENCNKQVYSFSSIMEQILQKA